jgi:hypothetical protein
MRPTAAQRVAVSEVRNGYVFFDARRCRIRRNAFSRMTMRAAEPNNEEILNFEIRISNQILMI